MHIERKSVPIKVENSRWSWTPYRIGEWPDHRVRVTPYFSASIADFTQEKFTIADMPYDRKPVEITQIAKNHYTVGTFGTLEISDDTCRFTSQDGINVFTAPISVAEKRDNIATAMVIFGACMATTGK